jgi:mRNA interferase RelE/StbE
MTVYTIEFKTSAAKELRGLTARVQARILDGITLLAASPTSALLPIRKLVGGGNRFRLRVGDYRVVYEVLRDRVVIFIVRIGHRKDVYR